MTDSDFAERSPDSEEWRTMLDGSNTSLRKMRSAMMYIPHGPRCKICATPLQGPGRIFTAIFRHGVMRNNPLLCNACFGSLASHPGGAELDVSVLFADIRGSTGLAERIGPARFRALLQSYYAKAVRVVDASNGIVDKLLGDGVMALFVPVLAGENHRLRAIEAGRRLIAAVEQSDLPAQGVRIGAGIQAGTTFVGVVGSGDKLDFSALGDAVNTAARLGGLAGPGELLVAADVWRGAGLATDGRHVRQLDILGREAKLETVALGAADLTDDRTFAPEAAILA